MQGRKSDHRRQEQKSDITSTLHGILPWIVMDDLEGNSSYPNNPDPSDPLFHVCWGRQSCPSCLTGNVACSWCAIEVKPSYDQHCFFCSQALRFSPSLLSPWLTFHMRKLSTVLVSYRAPLRPQPAEWGEGFQGHISHGPPALPFAWTWSARSGLWSSLPCWKKLTIDCHDIVLDLCS